METKMAPSYANIFMDQLEIQLLATNNLQPSFYTRFIDDIFLIWPHGEEELKTLLTSWNSFHSTIKFTFEYSQVQTHYLDVTITKEENQLTTKLYTKPTDKSFIPSLFIIPPDYTEEGNPV